MKYGVLTLSACLAILTGCASALPQGGFYTGVKLPVAASDSAGASKKGSSMAHSYLGMVATGDASIEAAKKAGGITKVSYVDYQVENILGLYGTYITTVYGE